MPTDKIKSRILILLSLLFASGCAALIYEVVWLHLLRLTIGVSSFSLGILLATFMGGMAIGSLAYAKYLSPARHPLRVFAALEFALAAFGMSVPFLLSQVSDLYVSSAVWHGGSLICRILVAIFLLLPPTILMGATLPAISRFVTADKAGAAKLGWLYAANIFGAVCGSLLAGIVLMQYLDALYASFIAAAINMLTGTAARMTAKQYNYNPSSAEATAGNGHDAQSVSQASGKAAVPLAIASLAIFLSGYAALSAEIVWTRLLTLTFGPTVYSFAIALAVFLTGLGFGSTVLSAVVTKLRSPILGLAICQLALLFTIKLTSSSFSDDSLEEGSIWLLSSLSDWTAICRDVIRAFLTLFPSAFLWGASFPLAVGAVVKKNSDPARMVGILLASNTFGAVLGSLGTAFFFMPHFGTQVTQQILILTTGLTALICLLGCHLTMKTTNVRESHRKHFTSIATSVVFVVALTVFCAITVFPPSPSYFAYGREAPRYHRKAPYLAIEEGVHTPIVVTRWNYEENNIAALHLDGKLVASDEKIDLRMERMLAHIPLYMSANPQEVLVVGLGAGITAGSFTVDERVQNIAICELETTLPPITKKFFGQANQKVLNDPRSNIIFDDAKHFLQTSRKKYDIISVDPIHPWVRGAAALYSEEFFKSCRQHLNPGGIVSFWVPLHSMSLEAVKSELATFFNVFEHGTVWHTGGNIIQRHMIVVGSLRHEVIDLDQVDQLSKEGSNALLSIQDLGFESPDDMLSFYVAVRKDMTEWLQDAQINRDWSLRLEYLAGAAAYQNQREQIYQEMIKYREWPETLFRGDEQRLAKIRAAMSKEDKLP